MIRVVAAAKRVTADGAIGWRVVREGFARGENWAVVRDSLRGRLFHEGWRFRCKGKISRGSVRWSDSTSHKRAAGGDGRGVWRVKPLKCGGFCGEGLGGRVQW
jgi:hypothetical protein